MRVCRASSPANGAHHTCEWVKFQFKIISLRPALPRSKNITWHAFPQILNLFHIPGKSPKKMFWKGRNIQKLRMIDDFFLLPVLLPSSNSSRLPNGVKGQHHVGHCSMVSYDVPQCLHWCGQSRTVITHARFHVDWTMHAWVTTTSCFTVKGQSVALCQAHTF